MKKEPVKVELTKKEIEIFIQFEASLAAAMELSIYAEPIYMKQVEIEVQKFNRNKRREYIALSKKSFKDFQRKLNMVSAILEKDNEGYFNQVVDSVCELLSKIDFMKCLKHVN